MKTNKQKQKEWNYLGFFISVFGICISGDNTAALCAYLMALLKCIELNMALSDE